MAAAPLPRPPEDRWPRTLADLYQRTTIPVSGYDVVVIDHREPLTREQAAALEEHGRAIVAVLSDGFTSRRVQICPVANVLEDVFGP